MSSSFAAGTTAIVVKAVDGYSATRQSQTVFHPVIGGGEDAYARPALPRTGTFTAVLDNLADAITLADLCAGTTPVTFADSDVPALGMRFLADGVVGVSQSPGRRVWLVAIDFHEVTS